MVKINAFHICSLEELKYHTIAKGNSFAKYFFNYNIKDQTLWFKHFKNWIITNIQIFKA